MTVTKEYPVIWLQGAGSTGCSVSVLSAASPRIQNLLLDEVVRPAANTVSLGGLQGLWPAEERCEACGDCALDYTGGICPVTECQKGLLNGPCGGAKDGKCEVDPEKDCGWNRILPDTGRL